MSERQRRLLVWNSLLFGGFSAGNLIAGHASAVQWIALGFHAAMLLLLAHEEWRA